MNGPTINPHVGPPPGVQVLTGPNGEQIAYEHVTPERAEQLLAMNTANYRKLRRSLVERYERDMAAGNWLFAADPIKVSRNGVLSDGQNRLSAQIKTGLTLPWLIAWDLDPQATRVMDTGGTRKAADHLAYEGIHNAKEVAAVVRLIILMTYENRAGSAVSVSEISDFLDKDKSPILLCTQVNGLSRLIRDSTRTILGYTWWRLHQLDEYKAAEFFHRLDRLADLPEGSPILALQLRLSVIKRTRGIDRRGREEQIAAIFYAWNAWSRGESRDLIKIVRKEDGRIYIPEPRVPLLDPSRPPEHDDLTEQDDPTE